MHGHTFMACYMHFVRKWRGYASFMSSNLNINKRKTFEKILIFKIQIIQRLDTGIHVDKGNNKLPNSEQSYKGIHVGQTYAWSELCK